MLRKIICLTVLTWLWIESPAQDCTYMFPITGPGKEFAPDTASVCILGDMMMHTGQIERGDFDKSLRLIQQYISGSDVAIANMEVTFAGKPYSGYPCFSAPDEYAGTTADAGVDVFLMANNHILDKGTAGLDRTIRLYDSLRLEKGIFHTGLNGKPLYIRANGIRICLYNGTYGTNVLSANSPINLLSDTASVKSALTGGSEDCDFVIALPHWGDEYVLKHNSVQQKIAENLAEWGADLIVGAHPHVVQDSGHITTEDGRTVPVIYSLGNAVSNMSAENTQLEQMAIVTIVKDNITGTRIGGIEHIWLWCSRPGGFDEWYTVIPVKEYVGRRHEWQNKTDYDKMMRHYNARVRQ